MVVFLFIWAVVSRFIGKVSTYILGSCVMLVGMIIFYFVDPETPTWLYFFAIVLIGLGTSSGYLMVGSILPDVIDMNEVATSKRREALFYSLFGFIGKIAQGASQLVANYTLNYVGYLNPYQQAQQGITEQPELVIETFRVFVSLVPLGFRILGMLLALIYFFVARRESKLHKKPSASMYDVDLDGSF